MPIYSAPALTVVALSASAVLAQPLTLQVREADFQVEATDSGLRIECEANGVVFEPVVGAGVVIDEAGVRVSSADLPSRLVSTATTPTSMAASYSVPAQGGELAYRIGVEVEDRGIAVSFACDDPRIRAATAGWCRGIEGIGELKTGRYGEQWGEGQLRAYWLPAAQLWVFSEWDIESGNSAQVSVPTADAQRQQLAGDQAYIPRLDGSIPPLRERLSLRFGRDLWETIGPLPNPPSPYADELREMVFVDLWDAGFDKLRAYLEWIEANTGGLFRFVSIVHNWQTPGYDTNMPEVMPPNEALGGTQAMRSLLEVGNRLGRIGLHNNYLVTGPAGGLAEQAGARPFVMPAGSMAEAFSGFRPVPISMVEPVRVIEPAVHELGTSAVHFDEHGTCGLPVAPDWAFGLNFDPACPDECMARTLIDGFRRSALAAKDIHQGPLFTETCTSEYLLGWADAYDYGVAGGSDRVLWPDYKLHRLQTLAAGYGMGLYYRYFTRDFFQRWTLPTDGYEVMDHYRAAQLLYANGAYLFFQGELPMEFVLTEIATMGTLQRYYLFEPVRRVEHVCDDGVWRALPELVEAGLPLDRRYVTRAAFANGYTHIVNRTASAFEAHTPRGAITLPSNSFVAWSEVTGLYAFSAHAPGSEQRIDLVEDPERGMRFVNPRGGSFEGVDAVTLWHNGDVMCALPQR